MSEPDSSGLAHARGPSPGPALGPAGRDRFYATRLRQLAHLDMPEPEAAQLWQQVARHRRELFRRLGRDVGQRVALLDFIVNVQPQLVDPQIIDRSTLEIIERRAIADALTGLYNRHYFESALLREAERSRRYGAVTSLMLLDIDLFKEVNDEYGHRVGDSVLREVGAIILKHVRAADVACRFGGDEFAVILPDTAQPDAQVVAERICTDIEGWFIKNPLYGLFLDVTVSGGVGTPPPEESSPERLLREADGALYEAKKTGGNRVSLPTAQPPLRDGAESA
jgi:diguanylate cyclase (GGDEF)-like protein